MNFAKSGLKRRRRSASTTDCFVVLVRTGNVTRFVMLLGEKTISGGITVELYTNVSYDYIVYIRTVCNVYKYYL